MGRGFTKEAPPLHEPERLFGGIPRPLSRPGQVPAYSLDGARFSPPYLTGVRPGNGQGPEQGLWIPKITCPAPGHSAGQGRELARGLTIFGTPEVP